MESKLSVLSQSIFGTIFLVICLWGSVATPSTLEAKVQQGDQVGKLFLAFIENDTPACEFQTFYASDGSSSFVFPQTTFNFDAKSILELSSGNRLVIKCSKGSFFPVFIQHGGRAGGVVPDSFEGPFYISMWLSYPQVPETSKVHVRYVIKKGVDGKVGIKIGSKGDYRFVADENIQFLP
jgi:hypothetical protein